MTDRISRPESFALTRIRDSFADWFSSAPRVTSPSIPHLLELVDDEPTILVRADGEAHPVAAGAVSGALAGAAMLGVATILAKRFHQNDDLPTFVGTLLSRGHLHGLAAFAAAWGALIALGTALGCGFGWLTRRLRNVPALMAFGMILSSATWMCVHALALPRFTPWLAKALPFAPMMLGAVAFGLVIALQLPLRARRFS